MTTPAQKIELLAPARDLNTAIEAIKHGADAVYMGASSHGARHAAANSIEHIKQACTFAHQFGAKIYVTVNTIIYDSEIEKVEKLIHELYNAGVDALIVQDMSLLRMNIPPIALHASTQCDIRTPLRAEFLNKVGFSQLVLPRELTLKETEAMHKAVPQATLEAFVHGALCVSYSGDCQAGWALNRRSANRGECPQVCRLPFDLIDGNGKKIVTAKHLLSLRDLNRSAMLLNMLNAGIRSFKIEGRLKDIAYVKNVTAAYSRLLDEIIAQNPGQWQRASFGKSATTFNPQLDESFNRGFTSYFTTAPRPNLKMASFDTPKWIGKPIGVVRHAKKHDIWISGNTTLSNGDGLGYFDRNQQFKGFRVNRVEGTKITTLEPVDITPGTPLYRNFNKNLNDILTADTARRTIDVDITLRKFPAGIAIDITAKNGCRATVAEYGTFEPAKSPQEKRHADILEKTGNTIFKVSTIKNLASDMFIPASILTALRRYATDALTRQWNIRRPIELRLPENPDAEFPEKHLTRHNNVANRLAEKFYSDHGSLTDSRATECCVTVEKGERIMTTRYCLRREMNACLRTSEASKLTPPLFLKNGNALFQLDFDCKHCQMFVLNAN